MLSFLQLKSCNGSHCPKDKWELFTCLIFLHGLPDGIHTAPPISFKYNKAFLPPTSLVLIILFQGWTQMLTHPQNLLISPREKRGLFHQFSIDHSPHTTHGPHLRWLRIFNYIVLPPALYSLQDWEYVRPLNPPYA